MGDTIAAVATAMGEAGIGIVRMSGLDSMSIVDSIFIPKDPSRFAEKKGYRLYYGQIYDPDENSTVDEVLVSIMRGPHSFTGEDVVEINCHGGLVAQRSILSLLVRYGARLADPGEFSKRAFINGRLDLAQAEAIIDLIRAKTSLGALAAVDQLRGRLSAEVKECRDSLLGIIAQIEASIDFPEDDLDVLDSTGLAASLGLIVERLEDLLRSSAQGRILRDGLNTAIIGQPNVGKSSLLNALLREERAIVTEVPGTTRDVLEEYISVRGIPLKLMDTAGIRETGDIVERLGVERAFNALKQADLVLFVLEAGRALNEAELQLLSQVPPDKVIVVVNKIDVAVTYNIALQVPTYYISALTKEGITDLEEGIVEIAIGRGMGDTPVISNIRHISVLESAVAKVKEAAKLTGLDVPLDLVSIDIRAAWNSLGEITGDTISDDLLDEIFSRFCIGK